MIGHPAVIILFQADLGNSEVHVTNVQFIPFSQRGHLNHGPAFPPTDDIEPELIEVI